MPRRTSDPYTYLLAYYPHEGAKGITRTYTLGEMLNTFTHEQIDDLCTTGRTHCTIGHYRLIEGYYQGELIR